MNNSLMESLECGICTDLAKDAVETTCCHQIFCTICLAQLTDRSCPTCRKENVQKMVSHVARRLINETLVTCKHCKLDVKRGNLRDHLNLCPCHIIKCPAPNCTHSSGQEELIQHISESHRDKLIKNAAALFQKDPATLDQGQRVDPIGVKTNKKGRKARLGLTAKYYCGGRLTPICMCCNGHCGPTSGCNCKACMKLDLKARLLPKGYLVNREGATARKGTTGLYYCGRIIMAADRGVAGYCGPTDGPNCGACRQLDVQAISRYYKPSQ